MTDNPAARVGRNVRAEMARNGITQTDLAQHLHMAQSAVSRRLKGEVPFNVNELVDVARVVRTPIARFVVGIERQSAPREAVNA